LQFQTRFADAAFFHCRDKIEHVAFGLAREALKGVLLRVGPEAIIALALVDRAAAVQLLAGAFELYAVALQYLVERHSLFDCLKIYPRSHCC
jgi:hypothetical protein